MQRNSELFCAVDVSEAGWIRDDGISNEGLGCVRRSLVTTQISIIGARSPASIDDLSHTFFSLPNVAILERLQPWNQTRVLHHEGHQLGWVTANVEELEAVLLYKLLEGTVSREADSMPILVLEDLAEGNKWLYITTRAHHLDHNVQWKRRPSLI